MKKFILFTILLSIVAAEYIHLYTGYLSLDEELDHSYGLYGLFSPMKFGSSLLCENNKAKINYYMDIEILDYGNLTCSSQTAFCSRPMNRSVAVVINERASLPPCTVISNNNCGAIYYVLDNSKKEFSITLPTYQDSSYCVNPSYTYIGLQSYDNGKCIIEGINENEIFCYTQPILLKYQWYQYC